MMDYCKTLTALFERFSAFREEIPSAGTRYRLMGLAADAAEVTEQFQSEVFERVSNEAVVDADIGIDYMELSEKVLSMELVGREGDDDVIRRETELVNAALGELSEQLACIAKQLERRHRDEEYEALYDSEKRRYLSSGTAGRARRTFEEWKEDHCYGSPSLEDMEDYRLEKVLHMFEKGVLDSKVEHIQRAKRYPDELDFEQLDDDYRLRKTVYKHYAALRKVVDFVDGCLVVNKVRVGQHFFACRHEENAKSNRTNLLKYMHKIDMVQQEMRRLKAADDAASDEEAGAADLNFFAPRKNLQVLLQEEWFEIHRSDKCYDKKWTDGFVDALMKSEHRTYIATEWCKDKRRDYIRGCVLGLLKEGKVIRGSMDSISRSAAVCDNYRTFSKYMGQCRQEPYAEWVLDYIRKSAG